MMVIKNQGHQAIVISPEDLFQEPDVSLRPAPSDVLQFARERNQRFRSRKRRPDKLSEPLDNLTREEELALFKELRDNPDKSSKDEIKECLVNSQEAWIATLARRRVRGKKKLLNFSNRQCRPAAGERLRLLKGLIPSGVQGSTPMQHSG